MSNQEIIPVTFEICKDIDVDIGKLEQSIKYHYSNNTLILTDVLTTSALQLTLIKITNEDNELIAYIDNHHKIPMYPFETLSDDYYNIYHLESNLKNYLDNDVINFVDVDFSGGYELEQTFVKEGILYLDLLHKFLEELEEE